MKSSAEYVASVRGLPRTVFLMGEQVADATAHPILRPSLNALAETYRLAQDDDAGGLLRRPSPLTGGQVNCFTSIHLSTDDLVRKVQALRLLGQRTGCCFQRCVGWDALNALHIATFEVDQARGTSYHPRFLAYLRHVQENDLVLNGAMTDVKGDRGRRPADQADPDLYLHVVERRPDGIVVRGAKAHQTGAVFSHEIVVLPTTALRPQEADYAVAFAVPVDTPGITHIVGRQSCDTRKLEGGDLDLGNARFGGHEALVIFDDVFVPWERVFLCGETEFAGRLVECFAAFHRQSYGGCKAGVGDVLIGAAALAAELAGVDQVGHVRRKLAEMVHLNETLYAGGIACSHLGAAAPSGAYLVDLLLANVCKLNVTRHPFEIARLAQDIAGGLLVTMPSERDWRNPQLRPVLEKYLAGVAGAPTEARLRVLRLIENLTMGSCAAAYLTESLHGAGSPEAQMVVIGRLAGLEEKKRLARALAGME
ncbi:MAG: 4-hydroxyphenylacetate 3-hydroxylase family protein [Chloroflexota bacterium]|nr:4-hydroxyphenylacetate 3-hydroxylase family protein [Chloroflexota bacterium]